MKCIDTKELEQFLQGTLHPERLLAVDEHIGSCAECKSALVNLPALKNAGTQLGTELLGVADCPEYEELSAFVDETLDTNRAVAVNAHVNTCGPCASDVTRIQELRSQAALRGKVIVQPGMSRPAARNPFGLWRKVVAAVAVAGAAAFVAVSFGNFGKAPDKPNAIALKPSAGAHQVAPAPKSEPVVVPAKPEQPVIAANPTATTPAPPSYKTVLRDGSYRVIRKNGDYALAKVDGTLIRTPLEARIAALIDEKIKTGKIRPAKSVQVAMSTITYRGNGDYDAPPTAPTPIAPSGKIMLTNRPTLSWSKVDLAESYRVKVTDKAGNVVFDETTDQNSIILSKPLDRGQVYRWQAGVRFGENDSWINSKEAGFKVLSDEDFASIQKIRNQMPGSHLALGAAYESFGLYEEAKAEYRALRAANPGSRLARRLINP